MLLDKMQAASLPSFASSYRGMRASCVNGSLPRRPFGEITDINMPLDASSQKHKGFAFVQYDDKEDAAEAIDNMDNAGALWAGAARQSGKAGCNQGRESPGVGEQSRRLFQRGRRAWG